PSRSNLHCGGLRHQVFDETVVDGFVYECAGSCPAHLSGVGKDPIFHCLDCSLKISVRENNVRILASKLHYHVCNVLGRCLHNLTTRVARASKHYSVDILVSNQRLSNIRPSTRHHAPYTLCTSSPQVQFTTLERRKSGKRSELHNSVSAGC